MHCIPSRAAPDNVATTSDRCVAAYAAGKAAGGAKGFGATAKAPSVSKSGVAQTCACGSKEVYRLCCEPYHAGTAVPPDVEAAIRARFCAFIKGRPEYLVRTFHPDYHTFKYQSGPGGAAEQLRRDVEAGIKRFTYSKLKILEVQEGPGGPDEAFVTFQYTSVNKVNPERTLDGTIKPSSTIEKSRFVRDPSSRDWLFVDYTLVDYPSWMQDAKDAEERSRQQQQQQQAAAQQ